MPNLIRLLIVFFFTAFSVDLYAQACTLSAVLRAGNQACVNDPIPFTATNTPSANVINYVYDFGDATTQTTTLSTVTKLYTSAGTYSTKVTVNLVGGGTCVAVGPTVKVNPLPICDYVILSPDTVCFKNNNICVLDLSKPGAASAAIVKRYFYYADGFSYDQNAPYSNLICYHSTTVSAGNLGVKYGFKMEITDANGCINYLEKTDSVYLTPETTSPSFRFSDSLHCTNTVVTFTNTTSRPQSDFTSFKWDFGDGTFNTTTWLKPKHTYVPPGAAPILYTTDKYGCKDTAYKNPSDTILFIVVDPVLNLKTPATQCFKGNRIRFSNGSKNFTSKVFSIYNSNNTKIANYFSDSAHTFTTCGVYRLNLKVTFMDPACTINIDTFIKINGPDAIIKNDTVKPLHASQCEAHDTVFFVSPNPYLSCHSGNTAMKWFWDFNDGFAPPCTTDTKNNVNVGVNCRYSVDSIQVKHYYNTDGCYYPKLIMTDTVLGCTDRDSVPISLAAPDAGWDSTSNPIRRGLFTDLTCKYIPPNSNVTFYFTELLPTCGWEKIWINFDSACGKDNWVLQDTLNPQKSVSHFYGSVCDTVNGWVTVGVIIKNGQDKNGLDCYDTAWYHYMFHVDVVKPNFKFTARPRIGCGPYVVDFQLLDTTQKDIDYVYWDFDIYNPPNIDDTVYQVLRGDTIIKRQTWTYPEPGTYTVLVAIKTYHPEAPCGSSILTYRMDISLGLSVDAGVFQEYHCVRDSFEVFGLVNYQGSNIEYWKDPARAAANKERIWWDIGDGKGYFYQGAQPKIAYAKPGVYRLKMVVQDSLGCKDTFDLFGPTLVPLTVTIAELKARIGSTPLIYYCQPQIIQFKDSTRFIDSLGVPILPTPFAIDTTFWDFGDNKTPSYFKNPSHNFTANGDFTIKLLSVSSAIGCRDTTSVTIQIKGPNPEFVIGSDSMGCAPFTVKFNNTTKNKIATWIWYFGDSNNTIVSDTGGTDQIFTYRQPGIYSIKIIGVDRVFNPTTGNYKTCTFTFPDTITHIPSRTVYVTPSPKLDLVLKDSICPGQEVVLALNADTAYKIFNWTFGDGNTDVIMLPDTSIKHTYATTGLYNLMVVPTVLDTNIKCIDTVRQTIHVQDIVADFDIDENKNPLYQFYNKSSSNATTFKWNFGQGSSTSTSKDGTHNYGAELGEFKICLEAWTNEGCYDSICKTIRRDTAFITIPNVFTPGNNDGFNDAFDIDIAGYTQYHLLIYNRWGGRVFEGKKDGVGNDGINWNGKEDNEGIDCPAGVYFFTFSYKLITEPSEKIVHGTITLLRE